MQETVGEWILDIPGVDCKSNGRRYICIGYDCMTEI